MPHKCTACDRVYPDGADELLNGCDRCGGRKFQFVQATPTTGGGDTPPSSAPQESSESSATASSANQPTGEWPDHATQVEESEAQSRARSEIYDTELWPEDTETTPENAPTPGDDETEQTDDNDIDYEVHGTPEAITEVDEVKDELAAQFESIKILEPGKYSVNPVALYENDQYVIALEEDGQYRIEPLTGFEDEMDIE